MFTGIVQDLGTVVDVDEQEDGVRLRVATPLAAELAHGDPIAVNGCCPVSYPHRRWRRPYDVTSQCSAAPDHKPKQ